MDIYELSSFDSINKNHSNSIEFIVNYKKSETVYYVKPMFTNQLINLLFQDSDVHIKNEHYVIKNNKYYYIRLDVDHADFVYTPLSNTMDTYIHLHDTLKKYNFSCNALKILSELLEKREVFRKSILLSLDYISKIFSDEY